MDINIDSGEPISTSSPATTTINPPEGPSSKSNMKEDISSNIHEHLSYKDSNVNMGEGHSTYIVDSSTITPPPSSPPPTSTITLTTILALSPTFASIINEYLTSLFSSQSTNQELKTNDEDEMVEFSMLGCNPEEEDVNDNVIMSGKQYKILNSKLNTILYFLNENVVKCFVSGDEVEFLLKNQESGMRNLITSYVTSLEDSMVVHHNSYKHDV